MRCARKLLQLLTVRTQTAYRHFCSNMRPCAGSGDAKRHLAVETYLTGEKLRLKMSPARCRRRVRREHQRSINYGASPEISARRSMIPEVPNASSVLITESDSQCQRKRSPTVRACTDLLCAHTRETTREYVHPQHLATKYLHQHITMPCTSNISLD
jgi:hypothetical protein